MPTVDMNMDDETWVKIYKPVFGNRRNLYRWLYEAQWIYLQRYLEALAP